MVTRKLKPTITEDVAPKPVQDESFHDMLHRMIDDLPAEGPSIKRIGVAFIAQLVAGGVVGYLGIELLEYTIAGAALLSSSAFATLLIALIGGLIVMYAAIRIGIAVQLSIVNGTFDGAWLKTRNFVTGLFSSHKEVTA